MRLYVRQHIIAPQLRHCQQKRAALLFYTVISLLYLLSE